MRNPQLREKNRKIRGGHDDDDKEDGDDGEDVGPAVNVHVPGFGPLQLISSLSSKPFSAVFEARIEGDDARYALKVLALERSYAKVGSTASKEKEDEDVEKGVDVEENSDRDQPASLRSTVDEVEVEYRGTDMTKVGPERVRFVNGGKDDAEGRFEVQHRIMAEIAALRAISHTSVVALEGSEFGTDSEELIDLAACGLREKAECDSDVEVKSNAPPIPVGYILMPFKGISLRDYVAVKGPIRGALALLRLTESLASALDAIHAAGYRHNELTPEAVLLQGWPDSSLSKVVLGGFGSVSPDYVTPSTKWEACELRNFHSRRTPPAYRAPEVWKVGRPSQSAAEKSMRGGRKFGTLNPAVDAFSLGCVLFYAMFQRDAFGKCKLTTFPKLIHCTMKKAWVQ